MVSSVVFVFVCWYVVALHYRQLSIFATFHQLLRHPIVFSAMTKVKDGRKGGPPKVRRSARGGRPSPDADELSELWAANDMLRQQLQQARTLTSDPVARTSSARDECSAHFCHLNHFCHSSPVLSIHFNRFCQPHHFCQLLSTQSSPVLSAISTTYVARDEVTTFVNKARPLLSTVIVLPIIIIIIITRCSMWETRETALPHGCKVQSAPTTTVSCISSLHAYSYIQQTGRAEKPTGRAAKPTGRAEKPNRRAAKPTRRAEKPSEEPRNQPEEQRNQPEDPGTDRKSRETKQKSRKTNWKSRETNRKSPETNRKSHETNQKSRETNRKSR